MPRKRKSNQYTSHNIVRVVKGGSDYFDSIEEIADNARYSLHLQTYIFDEDETGNKVAAALIRAAQRNVYVYLLVDGYASQQLSAQFISRLKEAGVHFGFFEPFFRSGTFYIGRRLHHKIIVADGAVCMAAGINISNRYNDLGKNKAWLDWAIHATGEVARGIDNVCVKRWNASITRKKCLATANPVQALPVEECMVRIRQNDWVFSKTQITKSYHEIFHTANKEVIMMTSYFWPPQKLLNTMAAASRRGIKIKLVLTAHADVPLSKYAERYLYPWLFRNNIEVYEYQANILHGKVAVCDDQWLTAGSYNVNNISAFASVELNLDVRNAKIATEINQELEKIIIDDCVQVTEIAFKKQNNAFKRFFMYCSYRFIHLIFFLFTFYFIQQRENN